MFRKCPICDAEATWTDEGLQTHIRKQYWNSITNNDLREEWRSRAIAVAAYLKEGK